MNLYCKILPVIKERSGWTEVFQITRNDEHESTSIKYLNVLHRNRTQRQLKRFFLKILQKHYQRQLVETLMLICIQKMNSIPNFFLRYCKDIANLLPWVLWQCLSYPLIMKVSPCRKLWCPKLLVTLMFICLQKINFLSNSFFGIL